MVDRPGRAEGIENTADAVANDELQDFLDSIPDPGTPALESVVTPSIRFSRGVPGTHGEWTHLLPPPRSEWETERQLQRVVIKKLPRPIRKLVMGVRSTFYKTAILGVIEEEVRLRAARQGRLTHTKPEEGTFDEPREYVPTIDREAILDELARDAAFRNRLRADIKDLKKTAARVATWTPPLMPAGLPKIELKRGEVTEVPARLGLAGKQLPFSPPEGVLLWAASMFWSRHGKNPSRTLQILNWGAGNSVFTCALIALNPSILPLPVGDAESDPKEQPLLTPQLRLQVDEVEVLGEPMGLDLVRCRGPHLPKDGDGPYDLVVVQVPAPSIGRGCYRDAHKDSTQVHLRDLGRLGPERWARALPRVLAKLPSDVPAVLLIPHFTVDLKGTAVSIDPHFEDQVLGQVSALLRGRTEEYRVQSDLDPKEMWTCLISTPQELELELSTEEALILEFLNS